MTEPSFGSPTLVSTDPPSTVPDAIVRVSRMIAKIEAEIATTKLLFNQPTQPRGTSAKLDALYADLIALRIVKAAAEISGAA